MNEVVANTQDIEVLRYVTIVLLVISITLFGAVIYFFKKDLDSNNERIEQLDEETQATRDMSVQNREDIKSTLAELQHDRANTMMLIRILAKHTGAEIGL